MADLFGSSRGVGGPDLGQFFGSKMRWIVLLVVVGVVVSSSAYTVEAECEGVVLRFGRFLGIVEPGLHFKLPLGIDEAIILPTRRQLKLEFGFATPGYTNPFQPGKQQM